jgi:protein-export membrane protein SecD/preprotein translocase SecF subunit
MNEREMWWKISLVGALCALAYSTAFPLAEKLKFGIDLYGGYSLLYEIDDTGLDAGQKADLAERVMRVLQERVDPDGVMNLIWRPVGTNRLEIQMPRPSEAVLEYRQDFDQLKDRLLASAVKRGELLTSVTRPAVEREAALEALVRGVASRRALLSELGTIHDEILRLEEAGDEDAVDVARERLDSKIDEIMRTNVDHGRLQTALEAGKASAFRAQEIERLKASTPEQAELIQQIVDAYDGWRQRRGREGVLDDPADLQRLLRGAGVLEFRILAEKDPADPTKYDTYLANIERYGPRPRPGEETFGWFEIEKPGDFLQDLDYERNFDQIQQRSNRVVARYGDKYYVLAYVSASKSLTHRATEADWSLKVAAPTRDEQGRPAILFELDERGGARFDRLTRQNINRPLCILLDDKAVSAPNIQSAIRTRGQITGTFTPKEVQELVKKLNAGSLPRKLKEPPISVHAIGPSLGKANRDAGLRSAMYGGIAVTVFMILYYFYAGTVAVIALGMNLLFLMAVLTTLGATLTLASIAGIVLSMGMAVDANILIFERIREEINRGSPLRTSIRLGYERAFSAILDSNVTTLITSTILYLIASEEIKGFGLTLGAGVVINLLTAVFVTRLFFEFLSMPRVPSELVRNPLIVVIAAGAAGAALWGLGYLLIAPEEHETAASMALGQVFVLVGLAIVVLLLAMGVGRMIHRAFRRDPNSGFPMLQLVGSPQINWHGMRRFFYLVSIVLTLGGLTIFTSRDPHTLYDIEFLGGTAAQIDLKEPGSLDEAAIRARLKQAGSDLRVMADRIQSDSHVAASGLQFTIRTPGVSAGRMADFVRAVLSDWIAPNGLREMDSETLLITPHGELEVTLDGRADADSEEGRLGLRGGLKEVTEKLRRWADAFEDALVQEVEALEAGATKGQTFEIVTRVTSKEVVVSSILSVMRAEDGSDLLSISPALDFTFLSNERLGGVPYFPIRDRNLSSVTGRSDLVGDVSAWQGGVAMVLDGVNPPQSPAAVEKRLRDMRLQPGFEQYGWRDFSVLGLKRAERGQDLFTSVAVVVSDENFPFEEGFEAGETWRANLAEPEVTLVREALERQASLGKITQFAPQVALEAKTKAIIALGLSWIAIIVYVWFRFGSSVWGMAAVLALIHDVLIASGLVAASHLIGQTEIGRALLITGFRIDLAMVAALLTVIGYSVNDTIIVFDRIRENRGRLKEVTPPMINMSINQVLSRTVLTSLTTILVILIMYITGGPGVHGFMFTMLIGIMIGTYSSIFVASPALLALRRRAAERAT